jgi:hypothetical protein
MNIRTLPLFAALAVGAAAPNLTAQMAGPAPQSNAATLPPGILNRDQAAAILPSSVFFRGQSATIQGRNSAGIKFPGDKLVLVTLVDASGYSSAVQQTYQAYLITEVPLTVGDQTLRPGAYGFGFVENNRMVVMDIGGNELFHTATTRDSAILHPTPLQMVADPATPHRYRLYLGRSYVTLGPAGN